MKKLFLFAAVAGLGLVSASPPVLKGDPDKPEGSAYPPCSRTVTDSCTQIRGRGTGMRRHHAAHRPHHARHHAVAHAAAAQAPAAHAAAAAPAAPAAPAARTAAAAPQERARLERIRRAGNRG